MLELGHASIEFRTDSRDVDAVRMVAADWRASTEETMRRLMQLLDTPSHNTRDASLRAIDSQIEVAMHGIEAMRGADHEILRMRSLLARLHFMRSVLMDVDSPFLRSYTQA